MFNHLHIHSYYSMMWGTAPVDVLAEYLVREGQRVFPLTDRNGLYGMVEHLQICERYGLRPIIGCELVHGDQQALCLVKTRRGYRNLCTMLTDQYHDPRWRLDEALEHAHEGLIVITQTEPVIELLHQCADLFIDLSPGRIANALRLQQAWRCPMVVTSHGYMISEEARPLHLLLRAIDTNTKLSRLPPGSFVPPESNLPPRQDMAARFTAYPKALTATREIAEACEFVPELGQPIFPPSQYQQSFKNLRDKTYAGLNRRYARVDETIQTRADYELDMIRRKGFANCFLVIEDVTSRFSLTCGRGSAAASIVSYALGITHVDPIAHHLFFERFLNPGRIDPPDIDVDFAWDERDRVRDYLWQKYGGRHIAMVCNHNRLRVSSAIREIAKVHGLGDQEIARAGDHLNRLKRTQGKPDLPHPWPLILRLAKRVIDYPRHISVHCGGVVITPDDLTHHCPLRPMPIGYDVIPWDKDGAEDYGFVKLDFLGNRSLAVIRDCLASVRENYQVPIEYDKLNPLEDLQTQSLIKDGRTMGCFYIESPATRQLLQKTGYGDYETLVAISSIIRPAANKVTHEWVQRHRWIMQGHEPNWNPIHPKLEQTLHETHGLMVYQEDVSRTAMAVAGFDAVEADRLRKIMSKKDKHQQLDDYRRRFNEGCHQRGLNENQIEAIWSMIQSFAGYSFCKPHSASYALVSFKSAFLKFHYPAEFMAAVISNQGGFYSTYAYLSHSRRMGIQLLQPDINDSRATYRGYNGRLRMGLSQIKGLRSETIGQLLDARQPGPFLDLDDYLHRAAPSLEETKRLILAGCFDELEPERNRPTLIWRAMYWYARHRRQSEDLFPDRIDEQSLPSMEPFESRIRIALEQRLFGFPLSHHPLTLYRDRLSHSQRIKARDLARYLDQTVTLAGVLITGKTVHTKHDEPMSFLTFEDETDVFECVMFPKVFLEQANRLDYHRPFLVQGEVVAELGVVNLTIEEVIPLDR